MFKEESRKVTPRRTIRSLFFNYSEERLLEAGYFIPNRVHIVTIFPMIYLPRDLDEQIKKKNWIIKDEISGVLVYEVMFNPFTNKRAHMIIGEDMGELSKGRYFVVPLIKNDFDKDESTKIVPISSS